METKKVITTLTVAQKGRGKPSPKDNNISFNLQNKIIIMKHLLRINHRLNEIEQLLKDTEDWLRNHPTGSIHDRQDMIHRRHHLHAQVEELHDELICAD